MQSLHQRAWIGGGLSALAAVALGTVLLYSYLGQKSLERFDRSLIERHTQIVVAMTNSGGVRERLDELVLDPSYESATSGRYWQIVGPDGGIVTSTSLFDATLPLAEAGPRMSLEDATGADGERLRIAEQRITLEDGSAWTVAVAESLAGLQADRAETRQSLVLAFALVAAIGLGGTLVQTAVILRPLDKLRRDVAHRWERDEALSAADYPAEVAPLVNDINALLARNREIIGQSRRQAADLAHALKTPSAILRNELTLAAGEADLDAALEALDRLDAQLARSLARIRLANSGESILARSDLGHSLARFARLGRLAERDGKRLAVTCEADLAVRMEAQDLEEVLGNVIDNALKWSRERIVVTGRRQGGEVEVMVEDDGPGIPERDRAEAVMSGRRLDSHKPGNGLGLAIATDLLRAYGGRLDLGSSADLGGLSVRIHLPRGVSAA